MNPNISIFVEICIKNFKTKSQGKKKSVIFLCINNKQSEKEIKKRT